MSDKSFAIYEPVEFIEGQIRNLNRTFTTANFSCTGSVTLPTSITSGTNSIAFPASSGTLARLSDIPTTYPASKILGVPANQMVIGAGTNGLTGTTAVTVNGANVECLGTLTLVGGQLIHDGNVYDLPHASGVLALTEGTEYVNVSGIQGLGAGHIIIGSPTTVSSQESTAVTVSGNDMSVAGSLSSSTLTTTADVTIGTDLKMTGHILNGTSSIDLPTSSGTLALSGAAVALSTITGLSSGHILVGGPTTTSAVSTDLLNADTTSSLVTVSGALLVSGTSAITATSGTSTFSAVNVTGDLHATGSLHMTGSMTAGASTLASLHVSGTSAITATSGTSTFSALNVTGNLGVTGSMTAGAATLASLHVSGTSAITATSGTSTFSALNVTGNLGVTGSMTAGAATLASLVMSGTSAITATSGTSTFSSINITGAFTAGSFAPASLAITGTMSVGGTVSFGSSAPFKVRYTCLMKDDDDTQLVTLTLPNDATSGLAYKFEYDYAIKSKRSVAAAGNVIYGSTGSVYQISLAQDLYQDSNTEITVILVENASVVSKAASTCLLNSSTVKYTARGNALAAGTTTTLSSGDACVVSQVVGTDGGSHYIRIIPKVQATASLVSGEYSRFTGKLLIMVNQ